MEISAKELIELTNHIIKLKEDEENRIEDYIGDMYQKLLDINSILIDIEEEVSNRQEDEELPRY